MSESVDVLDLDSALIPTPVGENHASFQAWLPDGSLGCAWFGGSREGHTDVSIYFARQVGGEWTPAVKVSSDPDRSEQNPVLTVLDDGRLLLMYTAQTEAGQASSIIYQQQSTDLGSSWSAPQVIFERAGLFLRQPMLRYDGRWLLPAFMCHDLPGRPWHGHADTSLVLISEDDGSSWRTVEVPGSTGAVHMCLVPLGDDRLAAFYRSRWADHVYRSESTDRGETWSVPTALDVPNNNSSIQVTRSQQPDSSRLLMVLNPVSAPEGAAIGDLPVDERIDEAVAVLPGDRGPGAAEPLARHAVWGVDRCPLSLYGSDDEGRTWQPILDLENDETIARATSGSWRKNPPEMSYPTVLTDPSGDVHITYTYDRQAIKYVRLPAERVG